MALTKLSPILTIVTVTFRHDLDQFRKLVSSIKKYAKKLAVCVVVNDDENFYHELKSELPVSWQVLHWSMVTTWSNDLNWWSQQYFKIMVSNLLRSEWYLVLDSDNHFYRQLRMHALIKMGRCNVRWESWPTMNPPTDCYYVERLERAFRYMGVTLPCARHMGNCTPFIIHTQSMKQLSRLVDPAWLDGSLERGTYEFFLYFAYLVKTNKLRDLYHQSALIPQEFVLNSREFVEPK